MAGSALSLRNGIYMTPDSWAYWEGALSLSDSGGFVRLNGAPITEWPPAFSFLLSLLVRVFGDSGMTAIIGVCLLNGLAGFGWTLVVLRLFAFHDFYLISTRCMFLGALGFICAFQISTQHVLLAHTQLLALFPFFVLSQYAASTESVRQFALAVACSSVVFALMILTHNSAITLAPGLLFLLRLRIPIAQRIRLPIILGSIVIPVMIGLIIRMFLGQGESHSIGFGEGRYTDARYAVQIVNGIGIFFLPGQDNPAALWVGFLVCMLVLVLQRVSPFTEGQFLLLPGFHLHTLGLFLIFNLTWIHDTLDGRFLWIPIMAVVLSFSAIQNYKFRWVALGVLCLLLAMPLARSVKWSMKSVAAPASSMRAKALENNRLLLPHENLARVKIENNEVHAREQD